MGEVGAVMASDTAGRWVSHTAECPDSHHVQELNRTEVQNEL